MSHVPTVRLVGEGEMVEALALCLRSAGATQVEADADLELWVVPIGALRSLVRERRPGPADRVILWSRGLEPGTGLRGSEVLLSESACLRVGALGGPLLPHELRRQSPCATVVASPYREVTRLGTAVLRSSLCRAYATADLAGV